MHAGADTRTRTNTQGPNKLTPIIAVTANAMKGLLRSPHAFNTHARRRERGQLACMHTHFEHACILSTYHTVTRTGDREKCIQAGMDDYISKPVERKRLEEVLSKWLASDK